MPKIDYPRVIEEDPQELEELEKRHRYTHLFQRVRMLRLLKSAECTNLGEAAKALGYSRRQCQRWFLTYRREGLEELLVSRVGERGPTELVTQEAFEELEETMKRGEIATIAQAHRFLLERGVRYAHPESVGALLRRRKVKLKTGRPRHTRRPTKRSKRLSKKVRREGSCREWRTRRETAEGLGL
jgi:transposase